jgi:hypothetical protein
MRIDYGWFAKILAYEDAGDHSGDYGVSMSLLPDL